MHVRVVMAMLHAALTATVPERMKDDHADLN